MSFIYKHNPNANTEIFTEFFYIKSSYIIDKINKTHEGNNLTCQNAGF